MTLPMNPVIIPTRQEVGGVYDALHFSPLGSEKVTSSEELMMQQVRSGCCHRSRKPVAGPLNTRGHNDDRHTERFSCVSGDFR